MLRPPVRRHFRVGKSLQMLLQRLWMRLCEYLPGGSFLLGCHLNICLSQLDGWQ